MREALYRYCEEIDNFLSSHALHSVSSSTYEKSGSSGAFYVDITFITYEIC
jgi:hypothetical protein